MLEQTYHRPARRQALRSRIYGAKISLTNTPKWCFFPPLKMKSTFVQTLKHTPADGRMSIWQRNCFGFGIVGIKR
jgi:hypothetical protein